MLCVALQIQHADRLPGAAHTISCLDYDKRKYAGIEKQLCLDAAGQPLLPCIGVQLSAAARKDKPHARDQFINYPLEVCR